MHPYTRLVHSRIVANRTSAGWGERFHCSCQNVCATKVSPDEGHDRWLLWQTIIHITRTDSFLLDHWAFMILRSSAAFRNLNLSPRPGFIETL